MLLRDLLLPKQEFVTRLARLACELGRAPSAGISLIAYENHEAKNFAWVAMAGEYAPYCGAEAPLDDSPCGYTLSCESAQLFHRPGRAYECVAATKPELVEGLVIPIRSPRGVFFGTLWVASHGPDIQFDMEDARILGSLADACGAALDLIQGRDELAAHAVQLSRTADAAAAANDAKSDFIAAVAHEMRNPLLPILTSVQILERLTADPALQKPIAIIHRQADQLRRLVEDLLDTARAERNELRIDRQRTELTRMISDALESVSPHLQNRAQTLEVSLPEGAVFMRVDHARLCEALANVVENASKYTPAQGTIKVRAVADDANVSLIVSDTGIGIPADMLPRIFELYSRADAANQHSPSGLGIGLWLVRRIVELHGGTIRAESDGEGRGATFTIDLTGVIVA
jgi:signal transduction histidine kinase